MLCPKCSKENPEGSQFCSYCGTTIVEKTVNQTAQQPVQQPTVTVVPQPVQQPTVTAPPAQTQSSGLSSGQKATIIVLLLMLVGALSMLLIFGGKKGNNILKGKNKPATRTVMIYLEGSNLESDSGIATADLLSLDASKMDLESTNILVYTGGTKQWHNDFVKNDENAIFLFTKDGYEKVQTYGKLNMGDPNTLSEFMKYAYENYPAGHYNLVLDDHGAGIAGAIQDDFTMDLLSLEDFEIAMKNSPFNEKNKLDTVLFRTCLNGTLEVASIFVPYSEYIVFSEEVSLGSPTVPILDFLHDVDSSKDGVEFGKVYVKQYQKMIDQIDALGVNPVTYSVVDLSKVDNIVKKLNEFAKSIDIKKYYSNIARLRANTYQYGKAQTAAYDTVDLHSLISGMKDYSSESADGLLKAIEDAVVFNNTNLKGSTGISIYFPYNGGENVSSFLRVYKILDDFEEYRTFITKFYNTQSSAASYGYDITKNKSEVVSEGKEVSLQLTDDQVKNYSYALYTVFKRNPEHPKYFNLVYNSNDVEMTKEGLITTKMSDKLIKVYEEESKKYYNIPVYHRIVDGVESIRTYGLAKNPNEDVLSKKYQYNVRFELTYKDSNPLIASAVVNSSDDERLEGTLLDLNLYKDLMINVSDYKFMDDKGNYLGKFESANSMLFLTGTVDDLKMEKDSIGDGEYYVLFAIHDINDNVYYSKPIKVGA